MTIIEKVEHVELEETLQKDDEFVKPDSVTAFGWPLEDKLEDWVSGDFLQIIFILIL